MKDQGRCLLIGGLFQVIVQVLLGCVCMATLIVKRQREYPQRPFSIFILDASKQSIGALFGHFSNLFLSIIINASIVNGNSDECLWYCLSFIIDCTFGTLISLLLLYSYEQIFSTKMGEYGVDSTPSLFIWSYQLIVWLIIIIISKLIILTFLIYLSKPLDYILGTVFSSIQSYPNIELVLVMIVIPFILNILQFYIQDNYLKGKVNRYGHSHSQILQLDLDEELMSSIELQDTQNMHGNGNNSSPNRIHHSYGPVKSLISKFNMNAQKLMLPKKSSSGDLRKMNPN